MADINRDLERYLRKREERSPGYSGDGWFERIFTSSNEEESHDLTPQDSKKLEEIEEEIRHGEEEIETVHKIEEELEHEQEERVSLYHQVMRFFKREHKPPVQNDDIEIVETEDDDTEEDFRALATIFQRWISQLPLRKKQAFMESEDYEEFAEILERRGVARRKQ